jgi:hypothetical protein
MFCESPAVGDRNFIRARITRRWLADEAPLLSAEQMAILRVVLAERGWTNADLEPLAIAVGDGAEEVSWQLGHKNSIVTRTVYMQEIKTAERTAKRRAKMEARYGSLLGSGRRQRRAGGSNPYPGGSGATARFSGIRRQTAIPCAHSTSRRSLVRAQYRPL